MEESIPENQEETLVEGTLNTAEDDEFAEIREHFESGITLTDEETDKVADLAVDYLKKILAFSIKESFFSFNCSFFISEQC